MYRCRRWRFLLFLMICVQPRPFNIQDIRLIPFRSRRSSPHSVGNFCPHCEPDRSGSSWGIEHNKPGLAYTFSGMTEYPPGTREKSKNASGNPNNTVIKNPKDFSKKKYKKGYLINIEKKRHTSIKVQKYRHKNGKKFQPYTNEQCYASLRQLEINLNNAKSEFRNLVKTANMKKIPNIDPSRPRLFVIRAWQADAHQSKRSSKRPSIRSRRSDDSSRHCRKATLHRQARSVDIQLDWIIEDDKSAKTKNRDSVIEETNRLHLLDLTFQLAKKSGFSYLKLARRNRFIHASCRYVDLISRNKNVKKSKNRKKIVHHLESTPEVSSLDAEKFFQSGTEEINRFGVEVVQ